MKESGNGIGSVKERLGIGQLHAHVNALRKVSY